MHINEEHWYLSWIVATQPVQFSHAFASANKQSHVRKVTSQARLGSWWQL